MVDYGRSMVGLYSLDCRGKLTRGLDAVIQDVYHMLVTVRGSLPANPEIGLGLGSLILAPMSRDRIPAIAADIESEIAKDDRFESSEANVDVNESGVIFIDITVTMTAGPSFKLIGPIGDVRAEIINGGN